MQFVGNLIVMYDSITYDSVRSRFQWSCGLRCRSAAARLLGLRVRNSMTDRDDFLLQVLCVVR